MGWPTRCADVRFEMRDSHYGEPPYNAGVGDLLWNPKGGYGHVIVALGHCGIGGADCGCGGWLGRCNSEVRVCECGEDDSYRDHHYELLARKTADCYVTCHPSMRREADLVAAGEVVRLEHANVDEPHVAVIEDPDCPPEKVYVTATPPRANWGGPR